MQKIYNCSLETKSKTLWYSNLLFIPNLICIVLLVDRSTEFTKEEEMFE